MDPITLATVTAAVTTVALEAAKGAASEVGKDLWGKIKGVFGWKEEPKAEELPAVVARRLNEDPETAKRVVQLLQAQQVGVASGMVGWIKAEKVIVAEKIEIARDLNM